MTLEEILEAIRGVTADTLADLPGYADNVAAIFGNSDAAIAEANAALEEARAEIQRLQTENYKLMVAAGGNANIQTEPNPAEEDEDEPVNPDDYIKEED